MQTLSHGYKKPATPDTGDGFFPALEQDIQLLNDHTHNGTDGALLAVATQAIASAGWQAGVGGLYFQDITMTAPYAYDTTQIEFRMSTGEALFPTVVRSSANVYRIYSNDNTKSFVAIYR